MRYTFPYLTFNTRESDANIFTPKYSKHAKGRSAFIARAEPLTSQCARRTGVRHVDGRWMWDDADLQLSVRVAGSSGGDLATKISRDVLRKRSQSRRQKGSVQASRACGGRAVCRPVARGTQGLAGAQNAGASAGCQHALRSLDGALHQRGVSRLRDTGGLDHPARGWGGGMASALGTDADEAFRGRTKRV